MNLGTAAGTRRRSTVENNRHDEGSALAAGDDPEPKVPLGRRVEQSEEFATIPRRGSAEDQVARRWL